MSRKAAGSTDLDRNAFDSIETGRLTWLGLSLSAIGWMLLLAEIARVDVVPGRFLKSIGPEFHSDIIEVAKAIIASGFALALIGSLQIGFGALNRFFEAVLMRSAQRNTVSEPAMAAEPVDPPMSASTSKTLPYRILPDGSVEVDTIVGTRKFASLEEAKDFI